jgi:hypothetical protein
MMIKKPSPDDSKPLPADYHELTIALQEWVNQGERDVFDYERRHFNGKREKAVVYCLQHALDLAKGCIATALERLPDSLATLKRALLETLFWARYVTLSKENAKEFVDSPIQEMKRVTRKNLKAGYYRVMEKYTNVDKSKEILESLELEGIPKRKSIEDIAVAGGLGRVYTNIYGFISMIAHGKAYDLSPKLASDDELYTSISTALGALECINLITSDWIVYREITPIDMLTRLIGV